MALISRPSVRYSRINLFAPPKALALGRSDGPSGCFVCLGAKGRQPNYCIQHVFGGYLGNSQLCQFSQFRQCVFSFSTDRSLVNRPLQKNPDQKNQRTNNPKEHLGILGPLPILLHFPFTFSPSSTSRRMATVSRSACHVRDLQPLQPRTRPFPSTCFDNTKCLR